MANTEIDSLSLDIKITGLNTDDLKNLDKLSRAVARLSNALKEADFSKLKEIQVPKGLKNVPIVFQNFRPGSVVNGENTEETRQELEKLENVLNNIVESTDEEDESLLEIQQRVEAVRTSFLGAGKAGKEALKKVNEEADKQKKKLSSLQKLIKRFKTILFIKAIRELINAIVQAVKQGIQNLAMFDSAFNETISKITTASTNIKNSLALMFRPIIETIQPVIENISKVFIELGNAISKAQASMKGLSEYTKISAKYMEDYAKSQQKTSLFKFDTFNTLDTQQDMYETEALDEDDKENTSEIAEFVAQIQDFLSNVLKLVGKIFSFVTKIIKFLTPALTEIFGFINDIFDVLNPLIEGVLDSLSPLFEAILHDILPALLGIVRNVLQPVFNIIKELTPFVSKIADLIVKIATPVIDLTKTVLDILSPAIEFIVSCVENLFDLLDPFIEALDTVLDMLGEITSAFQNLFSGNFDEFYENMKTFFKKLWYGLLKFLASMVDSTIGMLIDSINVIFVPLNKLSEWFDWGWEIGIPKPPKLADLVPSYANGGIVGELWQMNEYGNPEMLYNANNNGNTAVITQQQLSMAFEEAIYNTGLLEAIAKAGIIQLDGRAIAQSTTFKNEINRTNPGLNIR